MKIRAFFTSKNFIDIECEIFTYTNKTLWYLDSDYVAHTITKVIALTSV